MVGIGNTGYSNEHSIVRRRQERTRAKSDRWSLERLEERVLLASGPQIVTHSPNGFVTDPVSLFGLELSEPVIDSDAQDAATYELLDLGHDRAIGGGDDWPIRLVPIYNAGDTLIELMPEPASTVAYTRFEEFDYFGNGSAGSVTIDGESVTGDSSEPYFLVSDVEMANGFSANLSVETTSDDDFVGFTFAFNADSATNRPDDYYVITWKQSNQTSFSRLAEEGLKLLRVSDTGEMDNAEVNALIWDGENGDHIRVLAARLGSSDGWSDNTSYTFNVYHDLPGFIDIDVRRESDGSVVWQTAVTDPLALGPGRAGFFNYSQPSTRYSMQSDTLFDGAYQLTVLSGTSGNPGLRDEDGNALDGNADGMDGDDFVTTFYQDQTHLESRASSGL